MTLILGNLILPMVSQLLAMVEDISINNFLSDNDTGIKEFDFIHDDPML